MKFNFIYKLLIKLWRIIGAVASVVTCYFESFDEKAASQEGIQFMNDIGLVGQSEFLENVE